MPCPLYKLHPTFGSISRLYWSVEDPRRRVVYKCRVFVSSPNSSESCDSTIGETKSSRFSENYLESTITHDSLHPDYSLVHRDTHSNPLLPVCNIYTPSPQSHQDTRVKGANTFFDLSEC